MDANPRVSTGACILVSLHHKDTNSGFLRACSNCGISFLSAPFARKKCAIVRNCHDTNKSTHFYYWDHMSCFSVFLFLIELFLLNWNKLCGDSHVELRQTLESVSKHCHLIERLFFESSKTGNSLYALVCQFSGFWSNCLFSMSLSHM